MAARKEAELIVREAESKAQEIINQAEERSRDAMRELDQLRKETEKYRVQVKSVLESQLSILNQGFDGFANSD